MQEYNDYELVALAQEGSEEAINILYNKYKPFIIKKSKYALSYASHHGIDVNDIMQEGYIGLDEAIKSFSQNSNATFYTFATMCINRQIINYIRKNVMGKNRILNDAVTIDDSLERIISDDTNIEFALLNQYVKENITFKLRNSLTRFELAVFDLRINGSSFEEIANVLNKDVKSIYNTFHRIKLKFQKIVKNDD